MVEVSAMRRFLVSMVLVDLLLVLATTVASAKKPTPRAVGCRTVQSETLMNEVGEILTTDYDHWGYTY
jgi:hypothetical protein